MLAGALAAFSLPAQAQTAAGEVSNGNQIAPIGVHVDHYLPVPDSVRGPAVDQARGYRLQDLGEGLYMVTDNVYQSMFLVYDRGVVVVDAPPMYSGKIATAIREVTRNPVTHVIYSHAHSDHIGGVTDLPGSPVIIAHTDTAEILARAQDPRRPAPAVTFDDSYTLEVGGKVLELETAGPGHQPGNILIHAPAQRALMLVDVIFPGWMPWRRFALAQDVPGYFDQVTRVSEIDFDVFVGGHVSRSGTREDVTTQLEFMNDVKAAATAALSSTTPGEGVSASDSTNPWAVFDNYIDRVAAKCVASVRPKWQSRLAGFDVYIWDQCYAMEQSLRID